SAGSWPRRRWPPTSCGPTSTTASWPAGSPRRRRWWRWPNPRRTSPPAWPNGNGAATRCSTSWPACRPSARPAAGRCSSRRHRWASTRRSSRPGSWPKRWPPRRCPVGAATWRPVTSASSTATNPASASACSGPGSTGPWSSADGRGSLHHEGPVHRVGVRVAPEHERPGRQRLHRIGDLLRTLDQLALEEGLAVGVVLVDRHVVGDPPVEVLEVDREPLVGRGGQAVLVVLAVEGLDRQRRAVGRTG